MKKISFIVPIYNVEEYLAQCINSILNVDYNNKEIILINDGSTDGSEDICREFKKKYENIRFINKKNEGLSVTRNLGIIKATGEYIFFIDSDDFYAYDFSKDIKEVINESSHDVILYDYRYYYQLHDAFVLPKKEVNKSKMNNNNGVQVLEYYLDHQKNVQWIVVQGIYKKDFLIENKLYFEKGRFYEDILWMPEVFLKANSVHHIDANIYVYRLEREGQITSEISEKSLIDNLYVMEYWEKKLRKYNLNEDLKEKIMKSLVIRYYYTIWYNNFLSKKDKLRVQSEINKRRDFLDITNTSITKVTSIMVKSIGVRFTSYLFYVTIKLKREIKKISQKP